jgi:predicted TIM-barrel fold metal-dependent hydrolase
MTFRALANHAHVFPESMNPNGTIERLLKLLDACEIDQAVCFAPFPHQCDGKNVDPNPWLSSELKKPSDRLLGFGTIDVRRSDAREQVRRAKELGMKGLKLHPNAQQFDILAPKIFEIYDACQDLNLFITFHSGVHQSRLSETAVIRFDEIAWAFPRLKFSMEHVGGYHFFNEALAVIFNHVPPPWEKGICNVFAGLSSVFTADHNRFWYLSDERLTELAAQVGVRQLIFGLDFPYNLEEQTKTGLTTIRRLFKPEEQQAILGGNLRRELAIE